MTRHPPTLLRRVLQQVEAKVLVGSRRHLGECVAAGVSIPRLSWQDLGQLGDAGLYTPPGAALGRDDILQIVFTSGTTADPQGVVITHGNVLANIGPLQKEMQGYLKYERLVHPLRFLNLLPLSHVFGQFLGMFLPPLLGGTVLFQDEFKPSDIMNTIRRERVSVVVSVPRVLQSLKQKVERDLEGRGEAERFRRRFAGGARQALLATLVDFSRPFAGSLAGSSGRSSREERRSTAIRRNSGDGWATRHSGLWADGDHVADQREPSVPAGEGIDRQGAARPRGEAGSRRRDSGAWRRRGFRVLGRPRLAKRIRRPRMVSHRRCRRARRGRESLFQGAKERSDRHSRRARMFIRKIWKRHCGNSRK